MKEADERKSRSQKRSVMGLLLALLRRERADLEHGMAADRKNLFLRIGKGKEDGL